MPNPMLCGNGYDCPACSLRREQAHGFGGKLAIPCNHCGGSGRIAYPITKIYADQVAEARLHHWKITDQSSETTGEMTA